MRTYISLAITICLCSSCLLFNRALAQSWYVVGSGGGESTVGDSVILLSSIGQTDVDTMDFVGSDTLELESGFIPGLIVLSDTSTAVAQLVLSDGWNMVSVPLVVSSYLKNDLFPTAVSPAFEYTGFYDIRDTLRNGPGYWVKFSTPQSCFMDGSLLAVDTAEVVKGWNMIGSISTAIDTSSILGQGTSPISRYFGYNGAYYITPT